MCGRIIEMAGFAVLLSPLVCLLPSHLLHGDGTSCFHLEEPCLPEPVGLRKHFLQGLQLYADTCLDWVRVTTLPKALCLCRREMPFWFTEGMMRLMAGHPIGALSDTGEPLNLLSFFPVVLGLPK